MGFVVYEEAVKRQYHASYCSLSFFFCLLVYLGATIVPFYIAYGSHNFWLKRNAIYVQPLVEFKHQVLIVAHGFKRDAANENAKEKEMSLVWVTIPELQASYHDYLRPAVIRALAQDTNLDRKPDLWQVTVELPLDLGERVHHVQMLAFFEFSLNGRVGLEMDGIAYVDSASPMPGAGVSVTGETHLRQLIPLSPRGGNRHPSLKQTFGEIPQSVSDNSIAAILATYATRNYTMDIQNMYQVWKVQAAQDAYATIPSSFCVNLTLTVPETKVLYVPDLAEVAKIGWIQYLAIAAIFFYLINQLREFIYTNQVLNTRITVDQAFQRQRNPNRKLQYF